MKHLFMALTLGVIVLLSAVLPAFAQQPGGGGDNRQRFQMTSVTVSGTVKLNPTLPENARRLGGATGNVVYIGVVSEGKTTVVALGPEAYQKKIGLTLTDGKTVTVTAMAFGENAQTVLAQTLVLDGKTYTFRNEIGRAEWGAMFGMSKVTLTGTIKEIVQPKAPADANGQPNPRQRMQPIAFVLVTDKGNVIVEAGQQRLLEPLGLKLEAGQKITVNGWKTSKEGAKETKATAGTITIGDKTYTLRDEEGNQVRTNRNRGNREAAPQN